MRKVITKDFNEVTKFIKRKRYKESSYYLKCIKKYFRVRFPEFDNAILVDYST
jgi:hypothetical protein